MTDQAPHRNPILLGQVEEIDLVQPQVRAMLANPGIYVGADTTAPGMLVPLFSMHGKVHSMKLDEELDPERFLPTLTLNGPFFNQSREFGFHKNDNADRVFFYEQDYYVLSNFSAFTLEFDGDQFATSEAAYQYQKFVGYWDLNDAEGDDAQEIADQIIKARSAHEAFKIAEHNKDLRRPDWDDVKLDVMRRILRAKADQHEYVRRKLLATGDRELIEDSWRDDFWGWGPNRDGQNWLGRLWMEVRDVLRESAND